MKITLTITDDKGNQYSGLANLTEVPKGKKTIVKSKPKNPTPSSLIQNLYSEKYFAIQRTLGNVEKKLSDLGYNFNPDSIYNALNRSKSLKRKGAKGSYNFIQKYPPE